MKIVKALISLAIVREQVFIAELEGDDNPQTVRMVDASRGRLEALEALEYALKGDLVLLKIISGMDK